MNHFKNNHKRNRFRSNGDRGFKKRNGDSQKFGTDYSTNTNFQRKFPGRNNHNASKLIDKYNDLAREALSKGDKILSENYFQHADHFARILSEKQNHKLAREDKNNISQQNHEIPSKNETDSNQVNEEISDKQLQKS
tara:strand:+ start:280 stop:690 length:411 start_codon:yes stop_codon:yes gene_type:complete